jgi:hypothetical protein
MSARAGGDTLQGRQAYGVLTWVYEDPAARAAEGRIRVAELARSATGAALREIQDVGTMLARLAGSVQLTGIADQALDLAAWEHEMRGLHGEWVRQGVLIKPESKGKAEPEPEAAPRITQEMNDVAKAHAVAAAAEMAGQLRAEHAQIVHEILDKVDETNKKLEAHRAELETAEKHNAKVKLAIEAGVAVGGALLAMALTAIGVAPLIAIAAALGFTSVQLISEFIKKV